MTKVLRGINTWQGPTRAGDLLESFRNHLSSGPFKLADLSTKFDVTEARRNGKPLKKLWELTQLSANDFADEVARFFGLRRVGLADFMAATSLARPVFAPVSQEIDHVRLSNVRRASRLVIGRSERRGGRACGGNRARRAARDRGGVVRGHRNRARRRGLRTRCSRRKAATLPRCAGRRRHREPARPRERCSGRPRGQRSAGKSGRTARHRHSYRAVPDRSRRADAGRRIAATMPTPAGVLPQALVSRIKNSGWAQYRGTPAAAGWRCAAAGSPELRSTSAWRRCRRSTASRR